MTSKVLDLTTVGHAFNELCHVHLGDCDWKGINAQQEEFLSWYAVHCEEIAKLGDLEALASTDFVELNKFLEIRGFRPMFDPFNGIGVTAVLDMLVEWAAKGYPTTLRRKETGALLPVSGASWEARMAARTKQRTEPNWVEYPAFRLSADSVDVYDAVLSENPFACFRDPLIRLHTKTGHSLWLMRADEPSSGLQLNRIAQQLLNNAVLRPSVEWIVGVVVPMLEMNIDADLSWMLGMSAFSSSMERWFVQQAFQQFKLRANNVGAHVEAATGMMMATGACGPIPEPYVLDDPFIGFFTHPGNDTLPLAAFWADTDSWRNLDA